MPWAHPEWLWLVWALPIGLMSLEVHAWRARRRLLARFGERHLVDQLAASRHPTARRWKAGCAMAAASAIAVALTRPQFGAKPMQTSRQGVEVLVALDVSHSMLAEDFKPTRLRAAKREIGALVDRLQGDRIGLVVFAGEAFVQCPLTLDYQAAKMLLDSVDLSSMPVPGTAIASAIRRAIQAFPQRVRTSKVLVLVTDGEDHVGDPVAAAREAREAGVILHAIGLGTPEGEPIPLRDERGRLQGHLKGSDGAVVLSRLDESMLLRITAETGGRYYRATAGQLELDRVYALIDTMEKGRVADRVSTAYEERYQIPLALALILLVIDWLVPERRRRQGHRAALALAIAAMLCLQGGLSAQAASVADSIKAGNRDYARGRYQEALEAYQAGERQWPDSAELQYNAGSALYQQRRHAEALTQFQRAGETNDPTLQERIAYNLGNTYFRLGKLPEALRAYRQVLDLNSQETDAKYNIELIQRLLKEEQQEPPRDEGRRAEDAQQGQEPSEAQQAGQAGSQQARQQESPHQSGQGQGTEEQQAEVPRAEESRGNRQQPQRDGAERAEDAQQAQQPSEGRQAEQERRREQPRGQAALGTAEDGDHGMNRQDAARILDAIGAQDGARIQRVYERREGRAQVDKPW